MSTPTPAPRKSRRILAPLATLAVAGALVVGSGADFTSSSSNTTSVVASGTLTQSNSRANAAIFNVGNIKPGDTVTGSVVIKNTGSLPSNMKLVEDATSNFTRENLLMKITETKTVAGVTSSKEIYNGSFDQTVGSLDNYTLDPFQAGEERTYGYVVTFVRTAGDQNADQAKTASASYTWAGTQQSATANDETNRTVAETENNNAVAKSTNG